MKNDKFPVIEVFGPTLQGEGELIGHQTDFIRFAGCDSKCGMCDTKIAVDSEEIRERSTLLSVEDLLQQIRMTDSQAPWVTLSGGNPCLWDLGVLVERLQFMGKRISVETQGTIYKPWLEQCDQITVSPKGPGMRPEKGEIDYDLLGRFASLKRMSFKIVVFGPPDLLFAESIVEHFPKASLYLSVGNPFIREFPIEASTRTAALLQTLSWMVGSISKRPKLKHAVLLPQLHVLMYGNQQGI